MSKTRKRHQSKAVEQLKRDFPDIHADLVSGRIASPKKALLKAGIVSRATPAEKLVKAWAKANALERAQFLAQIGVSAASGPATGRETAPLIANGRYLLPHTIRRIETIMTRRTLSPEAVMKELGFAEQGRAFTRALARNASLRLAIIAALETWLQQQERAN